MRVLQINTVCKSGSTGKIVYDLHTQLLKNGHESSIWYGRGQIVSEKNICRFSSPIGIFIHALLTRLLGITGYFSGFSTQKLIKHIDAFRPDIVHLHNLHGYYVNIYKLVNHLKKNKIRTVWTFHDEFMFNGKCAYSYDCEKWKNCCKNCKSIKDYPASLFFDFTRKQHKDKKSLFDGFDKLTIATPSQWLADRVKESFLRDKKIYVIHNGINTKEVFRPREFSNLKQKYNLGDEKILLAVAPDFSHERKGGKHLLSLAEGLKNENLKLIIIGYKRSNQVLPENVITVENIADQHELAMYYSMADVFVITSRAETFSMVCVEALACGTPIIGFDAGAPREIVTKDCGKFVPWGNENKLKAAAIEMLEKSDYFSQRCIELSRNRYSIEEMFKNYMKVYEVY